MAINCSEAAQALVLILSKHKRAAQKRTFKNFLNHALKSANETCFWLTLLRDSGKKSQKEIDPLLAEAKELANILGASIVTLNRK